MDIVFIKELCIETVIGIYDWEREIKQVVCVDLELGTDISKASASEDIKDTIDYKAVAKRTKSLIQESKFLLVETLAEETIKIGANVLWLQIGIRDKNAKKLMEKNNIGYIENKLSLIHI